jgi:hypothetical protein
LLFLIRTYYFYNFSLRCGISLKLWVLILHGVEEPSIGDYITFHIGRNSSKSDINKFEVVCKITDKKYNEDFDVNTYNYNIIAYDSELLDVYPNYWIFEYEDDESKLIEPIHSSFITVHSENPIGN